MFCPSPAATRCLVPMALSSSGRNRKFPGRMIVRRMARAAEGGQRVCEPVMGHSVRHRDKGGKKTRCGATLFDTVGEAIWNSHTWIVQHHTVGEKGAKIQLFSLLVFFFFFFFFYFFLRSSCSFFYLWTLHSWRFLLGPCFTGPPLRSFLTCALYLLNHSFIWTLTISHIAWKSMLLSLYWAHFKINQDCTVLCERPLSVFQASSW